MSKLIIKDESTGRYHEFADDKAGYAAAQDKLDQLRQAGHRTDLSANNTGKRLQDMEDSHHGFFGRLFS
ncbi:hypothetical protein IJF89_00200 [Candidatus Saccharibacteria bacterium]|nr:hypothetical protein [Candidatus Saccharibacteria bacterium]